MQTIRASPLMRMGAPRPQALHSAARPVFSSRPVCVLARSSKQSPVSRKTNVQVQALFGIGTKAPSGESKFYEFKVKDIDNKDISLDKFKNQVVLVVNLASQCGFTPQYEELQQLYNKYSKQGFTVVGFPCNQFGAQEPGNNSEIKRFAQNNYGVKFPLMAKVDVNGPGAAPLFDWLKSQKGGLVTNDIKWNFSKFLINKEGQVVGRYASTATPGSIEADIKKYL